MTEHGNPADHLPQSTPRKIFGIKVPFSQETKDPSHDQNFRHPGEILQLDGIGGLVELTDGEKATLQNLVDISVGGVIIFTYPKANTPGCKSHADQRSS